MAPKLYERLRHEILNRDGWRCQQCGSSKNLDVHHIKQRSALGADAETNLITLCRNCHRHVHASPDSKSQSNRVSSWKLASKE